jgi:hypothetical protein
VRLLTADGRRSGRSAQRIVVRAGGAVRRAGGAVRGFEARVATPKAFVDTPGWQSGGSPIDPLPSLTARNAAS